MSRDNLRRGPQHADGLVYFGSAHRFRRERPEMHLRFLITLVIRTWQRYG